MKKQGKTFGRSDLMALAAVRYCLGRSSYIVSDCCDWLIDQWPLISSSAQTTITRDIEEAFARDDEGSAVGRDYKTLGMDMDRRSWNTVRCFIKAQ